MVSAGSVDEAWASTDSANAKREQLETLEDSARTEMLELAAPSIGG
jgi:hypothetical protein